MKKAFRKPDSFDFNIIVIGAGSAGLVSAYIGATIKAKVALIEKHKMGGDCLNTGCVPSKALLRSAKLLADVKRAREFGFKSTELTFDFAEVMQRVQRIIKTIEPHDSVERYSKIGVECITGEAKITNPWTVQVNGNNLTAQNIIIATGARPSIPAIPGIEKVDYYTSETIWTLKTLPAKLAVIGGGPIGSELAQCFARFGSHVTQIEAADRLLSREDREFSELLEQHLKKDGVTVLTGHHVQNILVEDNENKLIYSHRGENKAIPFDCLLIATGRTARTENIGLEELGITKTSSGTIETNEFLQTSYPNIFACGDVVGPFQFTHAAAHQAWHACINALFGQFKRFKINYAVMPWTTFTDPELARVGINETEAKNKGIPHEITTYNMDELDRAITDETAYGLLKVLTVPGKDKILGATILGEHAGDLICEYTGAMRNKIGLNKILNTIHVYPTLTEANKYLAGRWKSQHIPQRLFGWLEKYHSWQRR